LNKTTQTFGPVGSKYLWHRGQQWWHHRQLEPTEPKLCSAYFSAKAIAWPLGFKISNVLLQNIFKIKLNCEHGEKL
jgi:hypothetical protein